MGARRILLCDGDELELAALRRAAADAGFEVVDAAPNAVELLQLAEVHQPDAALVRNEVAGVSGVEVTEDLVGFERRVEVILVTSDPSLEPHGLAAGAFAVIPRGDADALERALGALREWLEGGERRSGGDRRSGVERRQAQDWSKVFSERRSGEDRRVGPRRKSEGAEPADRTEKARNERAGTERAEREGWAGVIDIRRGSVAERSRSAR